MGEILMDQRPPLALAPLCHNRNDRWHRRGPRRSKPSSWRPLAKLSVRPSLHRDGATGAGRCARRRRSCLMERGWITPAEVRSARSPSTSRRRGVNSNRFHVREPLLQGEVEHCTPARISCDTTTTSRTGPGRKPSRNTRKWSRRERIQERRSCGVTSVWSSSILRRQPTQDPQFSGRRVAVASPSTSP